jgi:hypothetical protein
MADPHRSTPVSSPRWPSKAVVVPDDPTKRLSAFTSAGGMAAKGPMVISVTSIHTWRTNRTAGGADAEVC